MTKDLSFFMPGKAEAVTDIEEVVTIRYKDEEDKPVPFVFKAITTDRVEELEELCTEPVFDPKTKKKIGEKLNSSRFQARLGIESTVFPNFKSQELLEAYQISDPVDLVKSMLSMAGEYATWIRVVNRINGMDESFEEMIDQAKN